MLVDDLNLEDTARRIVLKHGDDVAAFLAKYPPSTTTTVQADWIEAQGPLENSPGEKAQDYKSLFEEWNQMTASSLATVTQNDLMKLSKKHGCTVGKWILWVTREDLDEAWAKVLHALSEGKLGFLAKVTAASSWPTDFNTVQHHSLVIQTKDFTDKKDVDRVLAALREIGFTDRLKYKSDVASHLHLAKSNRFGLQPSVYEARKSSVTSRLANQVFQERKKDLYRSKQRNKKRSKPKASIKTQTCRIFANTGTCSYGDKCRFSHAMLGSKCKFPEN